MPRLIALLGLAPDEVHLRKLATSKRRRETNLAVAQKTGTPKWVALVETWTRTRGLLLLFNFEPQPSNILATLQTLL